AAAAAGRYQVLPEHAGIACGGPIDYGRDPGCWGADRLHVWLAHRFDEHSGWVDTKRTDHAGNPDLRRECGAGTGQRGSVDSRPRRTPVDQTTKRSLSACCEVAKSGLERNSFADCGSDATILLARAGIRSFITSATVHDRLFEWILAEKLPFPLNCRTA